MATVADIRTTGSQITTQSVPLYEALDNRVNLDSLLGRFGEHYNISKDSHIYKLLSAICGDFASGGYHKQLVYPRLQQQLESTHFNDLDRIYGGILGLPRLREETYSINPKNDIMTQDDWVEVQAKDAAYRARCLTWMRALNEGGSVAGMQLAASAACGVECDVFERYVYLDNQISDNGQIILNIGQTNSRNEFVIIPREPDLSEQDKRRIMKMLDRVRPVNTISSVYDGDYIRLERPVADIHATSERFYVKRLVTGNPNIIWPDVDPALGYWIEPNIEKEAPTFAFMDRQEAVTYLDIFSAQASSEHVGAFNPMQKSLFTHLGDINPDFIYSASLSFSNTTAIRLTAPWTTPSPTILVNNSYPIGYFSASNTADFAQLTSKRFWASNENSPGTSENIVFDFGRPRPINFIDFEVSQKPVDIVIEYFDTTTSTWKAVTPVDTFQGSLSLSYLPSLDNPWHHFELSFSQVTAQQLRVTFTRRTDAFPLPDSVPFQWSVEVRNLRVMQAIVDASQFAADAGNDILGNTYRTDLVVHEAANAIDIDTNDNPSIWLSQPNPERLAVESIYVDLRDGYQLGTMAYLDQFEQSQLDTRSQDDMESYLTDGVVIDEIFVDPITFGPDMHFYYSLDDTPDWDDKLWTPIPRRYVLRKGFHALPSPTLVKYFKIEFSNLTAIPYENIDYPRLPLTTYRRFPAWVQDYFLGVFPIAAIDNAIQTVTIDPLSLGFQRATDKFDTSLENFRFFPQDQVDELNAFILTLSATPSAQEGSIKFNTPIMWQGDLVSELDTSKALSRLVASPNDTATNGWNAELGLPLYTVPLTQSTVDQSDIRANILTPTMSFPMKCRHGYQIKQGQLGRIAYFVGLRNIGFYRRDYGSEFDEAFYVETLDDTVHVELNQFAEDDWAFTVTP
jgi:hypothetical protein